MSKAVIQNVRISYVHVWEPAAINGSTENAKYSVSIIIPKNDKANIDRITKAVNEAKEDGRVRLFQGKVPANLKEPLRDGDIDRSEDTAYEGCYFINASSKTKPGVLNPDKTLMTDQTQLYSGCYAHLSVNFYPYSTSGNRGIACGLNNIMKTHDGESLAGKASATADFADMDAVVEEMDEDF